MDHSFSHVAGGVYIGVHTLTGEHVAAKRLMLRNNPTVQREFDLMTKLTHPHVVGVRGFKSSQA